MIGYSGTWGMTEKIYWGVTTDQVTMSADSIQPMADGSGVGSAGSRWIGGSVDGGARAGSGGSGKAAWADGAIVDAVTAVWRARL
jgi:hypothetical protein